MISSYATDNGSGYSVKLTSLGNLAFQFGVKGKFFGRLVMAGRRVINGGSCRAGLLVARRFEDNLRNAMYYKHVSIF